MNRCYALIEHDRKYLLLYRDVWEIPRFIIDQNMGHLISCLEGVRYNLDLECRIYSMVEIHKNPSIKEIPVYLLNSDSAKITIPEPYQAYTWMTLKDIEHSQEKISKREKLLLYCKQAELMLNVKTKNTEF